MTCDAIISDWNGTITRDQDERPILESIARDMFRASIPWHPLRMAHILKARKEALHREKCQDADFDSVIELFRIYNERVIKGLPVSLICRSVEKYVQKPQTRDKLDYRVLRPVAERHRAGVTAGILSAGYEYGIQRTLKAAGYGDCFDFYEANPLKEGEGRAIGFELNVYKNKPQHLLKLLRDRNLDASRVVYLGDSEDDTGCFEIVGHPIVAFLVSEELKKRYAQRYGAFIPADEADLAKYLESV